MKVYKFIPVLALLLVLVAFPVLAAAPVSAADDYVIPAGLYEFKNTLDLSYISSYEFSFYIDFVCPAAPSRSFTRLIIDKEFNGYLTYWESINYRYNVYATGMSPHWMNGYTTWKEIEVVSDAVVSEEAYNFFMNNTIGVVPTYQANIFGLDGSLVSSSSVSNSPLTLTVTDSGGTVSLADGDSISYTYSGSELFAGFATSSSGSVVYVPGQTYTLSGSETNLYAKDKARPTYQVNLYGLSGEQLAVSPSVFSPPVLTVTASGGVLKFGDEQSYSYTYDGSEVFAGFATSSSGAVVYTPGNTYSLTSPVTYLYVKESPRPTYQVKIYGVSGDLLLSSDVSYSPIKMSVSQLGASFDLGTGTPLTYTYSGSELFAGFSGTSGGSVLYSPGNTYTLSGSVVNLYVKESPRPVYTVQVFGVDGVQLGQTLTAKDPFTLYVDRSGALIVDASGNEFTYSYSGDNDFVGFSLESDSDFVAFKPGFKYVLKSLDVNLYMVDRVVDIGVGEDVLDVFSEVGPGIFNMISDLTSLFYANDQLTFFGVLGLTALTLAIFLILMFFIF